jgi:hypothetical protein
MIILKDYYEILHLHQALLEGKFSESPSNKLVSASPNVAKICNMLVDELSVLEEKRKIGGKENWNKWRLINSSNPFFKIALNNAKNTINNKEQLSEEEIIILLTLLIKATSKRQ